MRSRVARRAPLAARGARDDLAVERAEDHVLGRQVVVRHPRRLDDEEVVTGVAAQPPDRTRCRRSHHEAVTDQLSVQTCDIGANAGDRGLRLGVVSGTDPLMISSFR
jgi:hypothetical protein